MVLFLDEIDSLFDNILISILRQLRAGYLDRPRRFPILWRRREWNPAHLARHSRAAAAP